MLYPPQAAVAANGRKSRLGSYGAIALGLALLLRVVLLAEVLPHHAPLALMIGAGMLSRAPLLMQLLPPARDGGLGHSGADRIGPGTVFAALAIAVVAAAFLLPAPLAALIAAGLGAGLVALVALRQIGGFTGDVLGAAQVVAELALWLTLAAVGG